MNIEKVEEHLLKLPFYRVHSGLVHFMNFGVFESHSLRASSNSNDLKDASHRLFLILKIYMG